MDFEVVAAYTICDDFLKMLSFHDDIQCRMTTAEVMTLGIVAALYYGGNIQNARRFFNLQNYVPCLLSHSRLNRRLLQIPNMIWQAAFWFVHQLLSFLKTSTSTFIIDSYPIPACLPCRSWRCKLYKGKEYLGYCAAKKLHYYGIKLHLLVDEEGIIIEFFLSPAAWSDIKSFNHMDIDLPYGAYLFGDRAYNSCTKEEELLLDGKIKFVPQRKRKSKQQHSGALQFIQRTSRKKIETVFSSVTRLFPRALNVRSRQGLELRVILFLVAYSLQRLKSVA